MKNNDYIKLPFCCLAFVIIASCSKNNVTTSEEIAGLSTIVVDTKNEVTTHVLKKQIFHHELISNGKIHAHRKSDLRFESSEVITHVYVKNGECVKKGQKLAELDKFRLEQKLSQAEDALLKAELELKDILIGQGHSIDDFSKVPLETMRIAKVKSGYKQSKSQYDLVKREVENATLVAPFDGIVANLFSKPYNLSSTSEIFCTVINIMNMEADFTVLENELAFIKIGDEVMVTPYAENGIYAGSISEINPLVDANGMVKVKAIVNGKGKLFSGMNIRISVHRSLGKRLVIPKTAVVLRSGKQVVFTMKNGKAIWNYVHTGLENDTKCIVSDKSQSGVEVGLLEGDTVIVTGNLNLAHEVEVKVGGDYKF